MSAEDEPHDVPADERRPPSDSSPTPAKAGLAALTLGALGVVFGDIGTSPLYAMKETFSTEHGLKPDPTAVYGVLSLIFWAITIVVTCKYVLFIMRAENEGEGTWLCSRWDSQGSGSVDYRVKVGALGCWTARRVGYPGEGSHKRLSGCITIRDHIRLGQRLLG